MYRIGEISKETGVSIRSLRYYDKIGLLKPSLRSPKGYRLYSDNDKLKLIKIGLLHSLFIPLKELATLFEEGEISLELEIQEEIISTKIKYLQILRDSISAVRKDKKSRTIDRQLAGIRGLFNISGENFHGQHKLDSGIHNQGTDHRNLLRLLRKFRDDRYDTDDFERLLQILPKFKEPDFITDFFAILRLSNASSFRLDELDKIERNIRKCHKSC